MSKAIQLATDAAHSEATSSVPVILAGLMLEARTAKESSSRVAAWAWLGKHRGMFTEQVDVRVNVLGAYAELTTAELRLLASGESEPSS